MPDPVDRLEALDRIVVDALSLIEARRATVDRVAKATLRAHPELDGPGRARVARGLHGTRCFEARLRWQLTQVGLPQTPSLRWAAYRVDVLREAARDVAEALSMPGIIGPLSRLGRVTWPTDPVARLATERSLPRWIAQAWLRRYGPTRAHRLAAALSEAGPITLRASRRHGGREALAERLASRGVRTHETPLAPDGLRALHRFDIRGDEAWTSGAFEVQDEGSQLIAAAVDARPGQTVLDLCAGSGGKTLALADHMQDEGALHAADVDEARLADLKGRTRRRNLSCVKAHVLPNAALPSGCDRVLVDAPCSALGTWRRGPDRRWHTREAEVRALAHLQSELLDQGFARLSRGGRIVYATCTLLEAENQDNARRFEARHPSLERVPCLPSQFGGAHEVELAPDHHDTDGFYIAAWQRV